MRAQRGFTLIELMVSLVVFSLVVTGILGVAVSMTNGNREQRDALAAQGQIRVPIDYIGDVLRQASPAVPKFNIDDPEACTHSAIIVTNSSTSSDALDVIYASGGIVTESAGTGSFTSTSTSLDVVDATGLEIGDYLVISNIDQGTFFRITGKSTNNLTLSNPTCAGMTWPTGGYAPGSTVVRAQHAKFTVGNLPAPDNTPVLFFDADGAGTVYAPEPLAENIEDLQVALGIDTTADGLAPEADTAGNADEWSFNNSADTNITVWPQTIGTIRAVRVSLIARSANPDVGNALAYVRPKLEDHAGATLNDNFRRRVLKTTIEFRNTGVSP